MVMVLFRFATAFGQLTIVMSLNAQVVPGQFAAHVGTGAVGTHGAGSR